MASTSSPIEFLTGFLRDNEIPVLRQTVRSLAEARERVDRLSARQLAAIVLHDPLMCTRVLRFMSRHRSKRMLQEISTIEHAVMMLGVEPFFHHFAQFDIIEDRLKPHPQALLGLLHLIRRAQRASRYAWDWAGWRCDMNGEEVAVAALLHELAEMLLWCFAPEKALRIQALQSAAPATSGDDAQTTVLGYTLNDLQIALCKEWRLPELLLHLTDATLDERPRVRNVKLAVDLVRHSANGWENPALIKDFDAIATLMHVDEETVKLRLGLKSLNR